MRLDVDYSGWCANEGHHAGESAARYLRGEIGGVRNGAMLELLEEIDFAVPQSWYCELARLIASMAFRRRMRQRSALTGS